jgi:hypothetical protein
MKTGLRSNTTYTFTTVIHANVYIYVLQHAQLQLLLINVSAPDERMQNIAVIKSVRD